MLIVSSGDENVQQILFPSLPKLKCTGINNKLFPLIFSHIELTAWTHKSVFLAH